MPFQVHSFQPGCALVTSRSYYCAARAHMTTGRTRIEKPLSPIPPPDLIWFIWFFRPTFRPGSVLACYSANVVICTINNKSILSYSGMVACTFKDTRFLLCWIRLLLLLVKTFWPHYRVLSVNLLQTENFLHFSRVSVPESTPVLVSESLATHTISPGCNVTPPHPFSSPVDTISLSIRPKD